MTLDPIRLARELLDRAVESCKDVGAGDSGDEGAVIRRAVAYLLALRRMVLLVEENMCLWRCVAAALADRDRLTAGQATRDAKVRQDLVLLRRESQERFPILAESASRSWRDSGDFESLAYFDHLANGGEPASRSSGSHLDDNTATRQMLDALQTALWEDLPQRSTNSGESDVRDLRRRWDEARARRQEIHHEELNIERAHAGAIWRRLRSAVDQMNPSADSIEGRFLPITDALVSNSNEARLRRFLFDPGGIAGQDLAWFPGYQNERNCDLAALNVDLQVRLGARASIAWVLERYACRCFCLRLSELQAKLGKLPSNKKKELVLAQDAALFLFDQGFEVVTEQSMGSHRPDIIAGPLLIEAKVYDGNRTGLTAVTDGLAQIHQYANGQADRGKSLDPVLLVFRLGGPLATPVKEYKIGNLWVTIAHVDLGASHESGCRSAPPEPDITDDAITAALGAKRLRKPIPSSSSPRGNTRRGRGRPLTR
jgi:hypothetical protein